MSTNYLHTQYCVAVGLVFAACGCAFLPKSECELSETDGKTILGMNVVAIYKNNPAFGGARAAKNENLRACGYISEEPTERGYLYWVEGKSKDIQEAKMFFEMSAKRSSEAMNYSVSKPSALEISDKDLKNLAKRIADKTTD